MTVPDGEQRPGGGERPRVGGEQREAGGERPPRRLLERPPSERLAASGATTTVIGTPAAGTPGRAVTYGLGAAAAGAAVHAATATLLLWTAALLVVAVTIGIAVGLAVAVGGGASLAPTTRRLLALGLALGAVVGAVGLSWVLSGMYLGPLDYLAQVYGLLVPAQLLLAAAGAIAGAR